MSELKMYVAIGLSELTERTKSVGIDKLHLYKKYTNITENDLLICSLYDLPPNTPFRIYFYSVGSEVREDIIKTSMNQINFGDADSWNEVSDRYIRLLNDLETCVCKSFENVYIGINLSFGDFCLLTPNDCPHSVDEILDVIIDFLNPKPDIPEVWERDAKLALVKRKILYRLNTQHVYSYTSHNDDYKELFTSMLNANVDTTDRAWEIARQTAVLLYTFLEEVRSVWLDSNGEPKKQTLEYMQDIIRSHAKMKKNYQMFLNQVSSDSIFEDFCWSYSFICSALLSSFVGQSVNNTKKAERDEFNDFHGFMPIMSKGTQTMDSFYCEQFGVLYSTGFLWIPYHTTFDIWRMLPALIHEFSHYISTPNRRKRNNVILELTFCSVIYPLISEIKQTSDDSFNSDIVKRICANMLIRYNELVTWVSPYRDVDKNYLMDSMFFLNETMRLFEIFDFEDLYEHALITEGVSEKFQTISSDIKNKCIERWEKMRYSFLLTYTMALREIRSDIAMCEFLEMDLENYILLMAREPTWAIYSWKYTADSVLLRFGFMTRYLLYKNESHFTNRYDFNINWETKTNNIIDNLLQKNPELSDKLENMRGYIQQYIEINLTEEYETRSNTAISIFEEKLFPMAAFHENESNDTIVGTWIQQFKEKKSRSDLIEKLKICYNQYNEKSIEERIMMNYQSRLIMRDLFMFFPNIDE